MRIIMTGGTGLIGRPLASSLAADGHEITVLTRDPSSRSNALPKGVRLHKWDGRTAEGWGHLADGADAVINLAGESIAGTSKIPSRWSAERKRRIQESRVYAGLAVVDAIEAAQVKPKVLIQASAVGYYGSRQDDAILDESAKPGDDFLGRVCVTWEESTRPVEEMGVRRALIRTGLVLAKEGGPLPLVALTFKLFAGGPMGGGRQFWPWIHMTDEIEAIRFLLANEKASGPFNLTAPNPLSNREFAKVMGRVLNRPSFFPTPEVALRLALGEISTLVLDGQRAVPKKLLDLGYKFRYSEAFYALRDILKK